MGRNDVPPRGRFVRRWGRTIQPHRGRGGGIWERRRTSPVGRLAALLAALALLSAPSSVVRPHAVGHRAATPPPASTSTSAAGSTEDVRVPEVAYAQVGVE